MKTNKLTSFINKSGIKIQKYSPEILLGAGIIGFVGTVVLACKATLSAEEILEHHEKKMNEIEEATEIAKENQEEYEYDETIQKQDKMLVYIKTAGKFTKAYAPSMALGILSLACILSSRNILQKRYLGAVAAYNAVSGVFETYRNRVIGELGEDMDHHFRFGTDLEEREKIVVDENGKKHKEKEVVETIDSKNMIPSDTARFFDSDNPNWVENPDFSMMFLRGQQNYLNDLFQVKGHLFLNEVYDALGFPETQAGCILGWVKGLGDDYIDFGLYNPENARRFVNGHENCVLLDFNHDGVIWDKI